MDFFGLNFPFSSRVRTLRPLPLRHVRFDKTLRHPLHAAVAMRTFPPLFRHIKFQNPTLHGAMSPLADVANLNAVASAVSFIHGPGSKPYRIPQAFLREPRATLRITKVAEVPQLLLCGGLSLMSRRCTLAAPPASQRKPP